MPKEQDAWTGRAGGGKGEGERGGRGEGGGTGKGRVSGVGLGLGRSSWHPSTFPVSRLPHDRLVASAKAA